MIVFLEGLSNLFTLFYSAVFFLLLTSFLPLGGGKWMKIICFILLAPIANVVIYSNDLANLLGGLVAIGVYVLAFHQGRLVEKISVVLVFFPAMIAVNYLTENIGSKLFFGIAQIPSGMNYTGIQRLELMGGVIHAASMFLRFLFWWLVWRLLRKFLSKLTSSLTTHMWLIVDMLALASFVAVSTVIYFMPVDVNFTVAYPICVASVINSIGCMYLASYICQSMQTAHRAQELEMQYSYYEERLKEEERVRSIYHDLKNHLLVLQNQSSPIERTKEAIVDLQRQVEGYENYQSTGNGFLDIILRDKSRIAREKQIDLSVTVDFEGGEFLKPLDISTVFGNGLDNAIEACEKLQEDQRFITVKAGRIRDMFSIVIVNAASSEELPVGKSSKKDAFLHGFGLSNMKKAIEKYEGQCSCRREKDKFTMKMIIPIPSD